MLLYSLFHLWGYGNLSINDIKNFRQLNSVTPGLPDYGHTVVSMPSMELFEEQTIEYKEKVLPTDTRKRLSIEA